MTKTFVRFVVGFAILLYLSMGAFGQDVKLPPTGRQTPRVSQIDTAALGKLIKPNGKPLLINFWATWCDPCREEFPDLVKIDTAYREKIDFITISLDDLADINSEVPKFLGEMKAQMRAYLLHTDDDSAAITMVSKDWQGNLPMTILYSADGKTVYTRNGRVRFDPLKAELDKLVTPPK